VSLVFIYSAYFNLVAGRFTKLDSLLSHHQTLDEEYAELEATLAREYGRIELKYVRGDGPVIDIRGKLSDETKLRIKADENFSQVYTGKSIASALRLSHVHWTCLYVRIQQSTESLVSVENEIFMEKCKEMLRHVREITLVAYAISELGIFVLLIYRRGIHVRKNSK
jgi:DNA mismatch repair ATPase MutS